MSELRAKALLRRLFRDVQCSGDLLPRITIRPRARYGVRQGRVRSFADHAQELDEVQVGLVKRFADEGGVACDHVAFVEEGFVGLGHASRLVDVPLLSRGVDR